MAAVVQEVTVSVTETAERASQADQSASAGKTIVANTTHQIESLARDIGTASEVIDRLRNETVSIGSVLDVIRGVARSEEHTSELQSRGHLVCRLLLEKKKQ